MSQPRWQSWGKQLLVIPPIVLAIGAYAWSVKHTPPLQTQTAAETARMLETIVVPRLNVRPKVSGFGTAKYARSWRAVTQVEGRINQIHPELRPGSMIHAGDVLLQIDDSDYRSRLMELRAAIDQQDAELQRLKQSIQNDQNNLVLENQVLAILQREFDREQSLLAQQAGSDSSIDSKRRELLLQKKAVQNLTNNIPLVEAEIQALQAAKRQSAAQIEQAQRDIERTKITAPFRMRVGEVQLEVGQFVGVGETLFMGYGGSEVEVEAQVPLQDIHRLFVSHTGGVPPRAAEGQQSFRETFAFEAEVKVAGLDSTIVYPGRFMRVREIVDAQTKMVGFVVGVENVEPHEQESPQPPLLEGAFCDVDVFGTTLAQQVVIPRSAVRNGSVYLVDAQNRLATRSVELEFTQDDYAVVAAGLDGGETLVVVNPSPAIIGMLVDPIESEKAADHLVASVTAAGSVSTAGQAATPADSPE